METANPSGLIPPPHTPSFPPLYTILELSKQSALQVLEKEGSGWGGCPGNPEVGMEKILLQIIL